MFRIRFLIPTTLALIAGAALATEPEALGAAECEPTGAVLCEERESCLDVLFASFCSREYAFFPFCDECAISWDEAASRPGR